MNWVLMGSQGPLGSQAEPFYSVAQPCLWAEVVLASSDMIGSSPRAHLETAQGHLPPGQVSQCRTA